MHLFRCIAKFKKGVNHITFFRFNKNLSQPYYVIKLFMTVETTLVNR